LPIDTLTISKVTKRYGMTRALAGVDLTVRAGRLCALLGANGAGKSTLLGIVSTLIRPTSGEVAYSADGDNQPAGDALRRKIGVLAHSSFVYGELTAVENLVFYARLYGLANPSERARTALEDVGLDSQAWDRPARTYSRGMVQRLALARALLHAPEILLLDEPFTGLDRSGSAALAESLARAREQGRVVLVATHNLESVAGLADHVAVLRRGKLAYEDVPEEPLSYEALGAVYQEHTE
jgi:heme exporter protein A